MCHDCIKTSCCSDKLYLAKSILYHKVTVLVFSFLLLQVSCCVQMTRIGFIFCFWSLVTAMDSIPSGLQNTKKKIQEEVHGVITNNTGFCIIELLVLCSLGLCEHNYSFEFFLLNIACMWGSSCFVFAK